MALSDFTSYVLLLIAVTASSVTLYLLRYLPVLRRASLEFKDSSQIIREMMNEINSRLSDQDKRIADLMVKVDILESRWIQSGMSAAAYEYRPKSPSSFDYTNGTVSAVTENQVERV